MGPTSGQNICASCVEHPRYDQVGESVDREELPRPHPLVPPCSADVIWITCQCSAQPAHTGWDHVAISQVLERCLHALLEIGAQGGYVPSTSHGMVCDEIERVSCKRCTRGSTHRSSLVCTRLFTAFQSKEAIHTARAIGLRMNTSTLTRLSSLLLLPDVL